MTYLEIVNKVLKKLREDTVSSVDYNDYSALIGEFVNDAKRHVENAWQWNASKHYALFVADGSAWTYDIAASSALALTGGSFTNERSVIAKDDAGRYEAYRFDNGNEKYLTKISEAKWYQTWHLGNSYNDGDDPDEFALITSTTYDGYTVYFTQIPANGNAYMFHFYTPQGELDADAEVLHVPWHPVMHLALLYALDERGEEIGEPGSKAWMRYETSLADAISIDSSNDPYKTVFTVP